MELINYYDCMIEYHFRKANMVADTLSHKPIAYLVSIKAVQLPLMLELKGLNVGLTVNDSEALLANFIVRPLLLEEIWEAQMQDPQLQEDRELAQSGSPTAYTVRRDGLLLFRGHVCVSIVESLKEKILQEAHGSAYAMHPSSTKMY